jgi:PIN domain nuclease of toxin-antitoxin system
MILDTHALIWYLTGDPQLPQALKEQITREPLVYVSAAVIWEIAIKGSMGKLELGGKPIKSAEAVKEIIAECVSQQFVMLDISGAHAALAPFLKGSHQDPFDRMLAAQSIQGGLPLVSVDRAFDRMGVQRLWTETRKRPPRKRAGQTSAG